MRNDTRLAFTAYMAAIASLNSVPSAAQKFTVSPTIQQKLENKVQESSDFLGKINNIGVTEQQGAKLGLGIGSPVAGTTNTATTDRSPSDPTTLDESLYHCQQINFDTFITYAKLDAWAKFADFQTRIRDVILRRQALDVLTIGFNGTIRAATSDKVANPLLQDVGIGWLQKYRTDAAARVMTGGATAGHVKIGAAGSDYKNLDALVFDAVNNLIDPWYREDNGLVVILGRDLLADKYFPIINQTQPNTEAMAADLIISQKRVGNLPAVRAPYFPAGKMLITRLDNLSRYYQEGARRRSVVDNAKRDRIENYESSNDDFVVEDYGLGCLVENIEFV
ncbi:MAG: phage major capsid protein, P2 family [Rhodocyclaceae bacterium]|nr:phage major capsid protein, P2 family [Rhodocyclaceae bacterium]